MTELVGYLVLFTVVAVVFVLFHLLLGKLFRPAKPTPEKKTIYECGEPTIGSSWIQFDLRFYVVALLFVIFDVEVAFFFPWAVVFGKANTLANEDLTVAQRAQVRNALVPPYQEHQAGADELGKLAAAAPAGESLKNDAAVKNNREAALQLGWLSLVDILIFFGVLLVGFAYLWRRGDLDWVRSTAAERIAQGLPAQAPAPTAPQPWVEERLHKHSIAH